MLSGYPWETCFFSFFNFSFLLKGNRRSRSGGEGKLGKGMAGIEEREVQPDFNIEKRIKVKEKM